MHLDGQFKLVGASRRGFQDADAVCWIQLDPQGSFGGIGALTRWRKLRAQTIFDLLCQNRVGIGSRPFHGDRRIGPLLPWLRDIADETIATGPQEKGWE